MIPETARFCGNCGQKQESVHDIKPGDAIGNYILGKELGVGGIGTVYLARHKLLNQNVAIKLHHFFPQDKQLSRAFYQASNYLSQLDHPHIVHFYDYGFQNNRAYQAMEYVDGSTLSELIPQQQTRAWFDRCLQYFGQIFSALRYAHYCQYRDRDGSLKGTILHGDIKPRNILVNRAADTVKIADFMIPDIQAFLGRSFNIANTAYYGTSGYMAPEQHREGRISQQTDIYSLGITMYQLLTGCMPVLGEIGAGLNPQKINPYVPDWLDQMIRKATQLSSADRFQGVAEMETLLLFHQSQDKPSVTINVGNISNVSGQLFIGQFNDVVAQLNTQNQAELVATLKVMKEAVMASNYLKSEQKQEQVEIINQIGIESAKTKPNKTFLKVLIEGLVATSRAIPDLVAAVTTVVPRLSQLQLY
jgi:serine/threonine protein kinase